MNRWAKNCLECPKDDAAVPIRGSCLKCGYYKKKPKPVPVPFPEDPEPIVIVPEEPG